jgi:hypothetical protein
VAEVAEGHSKASCKERFVMPLTALVTRSLEYLKKTKVFHQYYKPLKQRKYYIDPFKPILKTRVQNSNPNGKTEVHSLVSHSHLFLYLTAIKSLLRFTSDFAVVVHDDGSLTHKDKILLRDHVRGIEIINRKDADEKLARILSQFPNCQKFRKQQLNSIQLFDFSFLSKSGKVVALDSDTLFLQSPKRLVEFAQTENEEVIHLYEKTSNLQKEFLHNFGCSYPPNFNFGFVCFYKEIIDLRLIEAILSKLEVYDWWTGQSIFPILIENNSNNFKASSFDAQKYQNINNVETNAVFRHYWSNVLVNSLKKGKRYKDLMDIYLNDSKTVIYELMTA